jgi:hypothetical protein
MEVVAGVVAFAVVGPVGVEVGPVEVASAVVGPVEAEFEAEKFEGLVAAILHSRHPYS